MGNEAEDIRLAFERQAVKWEDLRYRSWMPGNLFAGQGLERALVNLLRRNGFLPLEERKVLDVGCGSGKQLMRLLFYGARPENLVGIDLLEHEIEQARSFAPQVDFRVADATKLPFDDETFDLALAFTTFTSMRSEEARRAAAAEIRRVLRPGGALLWYDFWINPRNRDVKALGIKDIKRLFPGCQIDAKRVTLAPPIARRLAGTSWLACAVLETIPLLRTHWLVLIRPPATAAP